MKVNLKILALPMLSDAIGSKETAETFDGTTVEDLLGHLVRRYGIKARRGLYDQDGELDLMIQILHNEKAWISHDELDTPLEDGDSLILMFLAGGG